MHIILPIYSLSLHDVKVIMGYLITIVTNYFLYGKRLVFPFI